VFFTLSNVRVEIVVEWFVNKELLPTVNKTNDRQRYTETDGDKQRQTETNSDRQINRETGRDRERQGETGRQAERRTETERQIYVSTNIQNLTISRKTETDRDRERDRDTLNKCFFPASSFRSPSL
jgi:hypothetical protein